MTTTPGATITYSVPHEGAVKISLHDATGRLVRTLVDSAPGRGTHGLTWDGTDNQGRRVRAGICFAQASAGQDRVTRRVVLIR